MYDVLEIIYKVRGGHGRYVVHSDSRLLCNVYDGDFDRRSALGPYRATRQFACRPKALDYTSKTRQNSNSDNNRGVYKDETTAVGDASYVDVSDHQAVETHTLAIHITVDI